MQIVCLEHVPFEGPGSIAPWAAARGVALQRVLFPEAPRAPRIAAHDWLLVMGGPMGVGDEGRFPWLAAEKELIRRAIAEGGTVIGICLGAQLIAAALGAAVRPNPLREIGWFPIRKHPRALAAEVLPCLPREFLAFHWHGETFEIPGGAIPLAGSGACANQGFVFQQRVFAFQFHLETTPESARGLVAHCGAELAGGGPWVQDAAEIFADPQRFAHINGLMTAFLDALLADRGGALQP